MIDGKRRSRVAVFRCRVVAFVLTILFAVIYSAFPMTRFGDSSVLCSQMPSYPWCNLRSVTPSLLALFSPLADW